MAHGDAHKVKVFESRRGLGPVLHEKCYEGYGGSGEYVLTGLSRENLQQLADWMIQLPSELYGHVEEWSRFLERFLADERLT